MALTRLWRERRFSVIETFFVSCLVGGLVLVTSGLLHVPKEAKPLRTIYGPERQSEHVEEWIVRDFFNDKRGGFFVDVGANHYKRFSNTYYLETELGWSGLAIEPLLQFEAEYVQYRPRTRFLPFFVSDESDAEAKMFLVMSKNSIGVVPVVGSIGFVPLNSVQCSDGVGTTPQPRRRQPAVALTIGTLRPFQERQGYEISRLPSHAADR